MIIKKITRSSIHVDSEGKTLTLQVEALQRVPGQPDFIIFSNMIKHWDPPFAAVPIDEKAKGIILDEVCKCLAEQNILCEIE